MSKRMRSLYIFYVKTQYNAVRPSCKNAVRLHGIDAIHRDRARAVQLSAPAAIANPVLQKHEIYTFLPLLGHVHIPFDLPLLTILIAKSDKLPLSMQAERDAPPLAALAPLRGALSLLAGRHHRFAAVSPWTLFPVSHPCGRETQKYLRQPSADEGIFVKSRLLFCD